MQKLKENRNYKKSYYKKYVNNLTVQNHGDVVNHFENIAFESFNICSEWFLDCCYS